MGNPQVLVKIKGDIRDYDKKLKGMRRSTARTAKSMKDSFKGVAKAVGAAGAAFSVFAKKMIMSAAEEETVMRVTTSLMTAHNEAFEGMEKDIDKFLKTLEKLTTFNDTELQKAMKILLATGMDYNTALEAMNTTTSMAFSLNRDLQGMALLVGKAFAGDIGTLSRYGIILEKYLTTEQKLPALMKFVADNYAEAAERATTFEGALANVNNQFMNFFEQVAAPILPKAAGVMGDMADGLERMRKRGLGRTAVEDLSTIMTLFILKGNEAGHVSDDVTMRQIEMWQAFQRTGQAIEDAGEELERFTEAGKAFRDSKTLGFTKDGVGTQEDLIQLYKIANETYQKKLALAEEDELITIKEGIMLNAMLNSIDSIASTAKTEFNIRRSILDLIIRTNEELRTTAALAQEALPRFFTPEAEAVRSGRQRQPRSFFDRETGKTHYPGTEGYRQGLKQMNTINSTITVNNPASDSDTAAATEEGILEALKGMK